MNFRGKLQFKLLTWTVHTQKPSRTAHVRKHEATFSCLVAAQRTGHTALGLFQERKPGILASSEGNIFGPFHKEAVQ